MRRLAVAATAALMLTLSACGAGTAQTATELVATSADKAAEAKTARMSGEVTIDVQGQHKVLPLDGVLDFGSGAYEFTYDMSQLGAPGGPGLEMKARIVDGVMYLNFGDLARGSERLEQLTGGKSWARLDLSAMLGTDATGGLGETNPSDTLDSLRGADNVKKLGTETIRGVETTHYRATVDPKKALEAAPDGMRAKIKQGLDMLKGPLPIDVWLDADGQPRKVSMDMNMGVGSAAVTIEYYDFGVDVDISAPPADDVFDFSQLTGGMRTRTGVGTPPV